MKKWILTAVLALLAMPLARADGELEKLVRDVLQLRSGGTDARVKASLEEDYRWTLMTEVGLWNEGECTFEDDYEVFSVNDFAVDIAERRVGQNRSAGLFCNGLDKQYQHSFIEKSLRPGVSLCYVLPERSGMQEVVVVPYHSASAWEVTLETGGEPVTPSLTPDGCIRFRVRAAADGILRLQWKNASDEAESVVILNYNSRQ